MERIVGLKSYGYDWANVYGLSMGQAARWMADHGVDWALIQNLIDPLPGSAVSQQPPTGSYDDVTFRRHLREAGVRYFESTTVFHDPDGYAADPELRPVDASGATFTPTGWYVGVCPSDAQYVRRKAEVVTRAVEQLSPDGVFVSFIRFPGFWELWMPETRRADITEYCFCARCLQRFQAESGLSLSGTRAQEVAAIQHELYGEWTNWKCGLIAEAVRTIRESVHQVAPGIPVVLNSFGLLRSDFDNAVEQVLAQRFDTLDAVVDFYELMFYFQIQRREPDGWIQRRVAEARARSRRPLLACLQGGPEYLEPEYAEGRRATQITDDEWLRALRATAESGADGVLVYSWRDLLADEARGGQRSQQLLRYRRGDI